MKNLSAAALLSVAAIALPAHAADYKIDNDGAHAFIQFKVQHLGYSWLLGRFNEFSGNFSYDPENLDDASVNVTINTESVDSNHGERDKHLRSKDFLHTDKFPKATFKSTKIEADDDGEFNIIGDLTLHGVTKQITIEAEKVGEGKDPWGGYRAGFEGETEFELEDFGIKNILGPASATVHLELHVEGIRQ